MEMFLSKKTAMVYEIIKINVGKAELFSTRSWNTRKWESPATLAERLILNRGYFLVSHRRFFPNLLPKEAGEGHSSLKGIGQNDIKRVHKRITTGIGRDV